MKTTNQSLIADTALSDPALDRLDRSQFAKSLATSIQTLDGNDSFAIGLCGPWGSGKTSVLNFVLSSISQDEAASTIIVRFNPWWFSGRDHLLDAFLSQFTSVLSAPQRGDKAKKAGKLLGTLSSALKPMSLLPFVGEFAKTGMEAADAMAAASNAYAEAVSKDVNAIRKQIDELLTESENRIVVVMDDIDRLAASEIAQLFLILKAVADFPRTVYLLAFDHEVVTKAINEQLGVDGTTYLEKIIQLQIDVPPTAQTAIHQMFFEQLNQVIGDIDFTEEQKQYFGNIFHDGLKEFLVTPRAAKKLINMLRFVFPPLRGEVNVADMIGIACLNTFVPQIIPIIAANSDQFVGTGSSGFSPYGRDDRKERESLHRGWLNQVDEKHRQAVEGIVTRLFPAVSYALGGSGYGSGFADTWEQQLRVCSSSHFEKYFRLAIPQGAVSEREWLAVADLLGDEDALDARLESYAGEAGPHGMRTRASEVLDRALVFARTCSEEQAIPLLQSILRIGDTLHAVKDETNVGGIVDIDNERRLDWLTRSLLEKVDKDRREPMLSEAISAARFSLIVGAELLVSLGYLNGTYGETDSRHDRRDEPLLTKAAVRRLAKQIREVLNESSTLATQPRFMSAVFNWWRMGGKEEAKQWIAENTKDSELLLSALLQCVSTMRSHGLNDRVEVRTEYINTGFLKNVFDLLELRTQCEKLLASPPDWLTERLRIVLNITVDCITPKGKPVDQWTERRGIPTKQKKRRKRTRKTKNEATESASGEETLTEIEGR